MKSGYIFERQGNAGIVEMIWNISSEIQGK